MRSSGFSATSGSRLFIIIRKEASCIQPLQEISVPRGARIAVVVDIFSIVARETGTANPRPVLNENVRTNEPLKKAPPIGGASFLPSERSVEIHVVSFFDDDRSLLL